LINLTKPGVVITLSVFCFQLKAENGATILGIVQWLTRGRYGRMVVVAVRAIEENVGIKRII
jgi:hypothetical protein